MKAKEKIMLIGCILIFLSECAVADCSSCYGGMFNTLNTIVNIIILIFVCSIIVFLYKCLSLYFSVK